MRYGLNLINGEEFSLIKPGALEKSLAFIQLNDMAMKS